MFRRWKARRKVNRRFKMLTDERRFRIRSAEPYRFYGTDRPLPKPEDDK